MSGSAPASPGLGPAAPGRSRGARPRYVTPTRPHARAGGPSEERCIGGPSQSAGGPPRGRGVWPRATYGLGGRGGRGLREPQLRRWELPSPDGGRGGEPPPLPSPLASASDSEVRSRVRRASAGHPSPALAWESRTWAGQLEDHVYWRERLTKLGTDSGPVVPGRPGRWPRWPFLLPSTSLMVSQTWHPGMKSIPPNHALWPRSRLKRSWRSFPQQTLFFQFQTDGILRTFSKRFSQIRIFFSFKKKTNVPLNRNWIQDSDGGRTTGSWGALVTITASLSKICVRLLFSGSYQNVSATWYLPW